MSDGELGGDASSSMAPLEVRFVEQVLLITESLSFGRRADLCLDEANSFMHRITGVFEPQSNNWWLHNAGSTSRLRVFGSDGSRLDLPSKTSACLAAPTGTISFSAGATPYEITYRLTDAAVGSAAELRPAGGKETSTFGAALTSRQIDYLVEFARPILTDSGQPPPSYKEVAKRTGVSRKTVDNSLQDVRRRLTESGVRDIETLEQLIAHLLATGKVTYSHLLERDS